MCPDEETLSAYLDGEVEEPFKSKITEHVKACVRCSGKLESLQRIKSILLEENDPEYIESMENVKRRIQISVVADNYFFGRLNSFWKRKVALPVPLAVAAIVLFFIFGFFLISNIADNSGIHLMKIRTEPSGVTEVQVAAPIEDLEQLLKFIDNSNFKKEVIIKLPSQSQFLMLGKPAIVKEAEFSGVR